MNRGIRSAVARKYRKPREVSQVSPGHFEKGVFYLDGQHPRGLWLATSKTDLARIVDGKIETKKPHGGRARKVEDHARGRGHAPRAFLPARRSAQEQSGRQPSVRG